MDVQMVMTCLGELPFSDLEFKTTQQDDGAVLVVAREWFYKGSDPAVLAAVEKLETPNHHVRRDVWGTMKTGLKAGAVMNTSGD